MWTSYRNFTVDHIVLESRGAKSFYLLPSDGLPLAPYSPGQHLPLRLKIPGQSEPIYRFYTLSDCDGSNCYRLTIKKELPPPGIAGVTGGLSSSYFHDIVRVGDRIEAKAPAGDFFLDLHCDHPVVFIAGGIGVTPLLSMLNAVAKHQLARQVWFFFALRNGGDHVFKDHLRTLLNSHANIRACILYDQAEPSDRLGVDYHRSGRVDMPLLKSILPTLNLEYYICGPDSMMRTLLNGLLGAGVPKEQLRTESFGPSSSAFLSDNITTPKPSPPSSVANGSACTVTFRKSGRTVAWNPSAKSLWHFAEQAGVEINSGCLYGDCGTCLTPLLEGRVVYNHQTSARVDPGTCLPCSCKPDGSIVIEG